MKTALIIMSLAAACLLAIELHNEKAAHELTKADLLDAMVEVERLEVKVYTYRSIVNDLRTGRID